MDTQTGFPIKKEQYEVKDGKEILIKEKIEEYKKVTKSEDIFKANEKVRIKTIKKNIKENEIPQG
jgi:hypothetical protein